nr:MAG TPA: hypothetical protein [Caudoviricetes sp.]
MLYRSMDGYLTKYKADPVPAWKRICTDEE